MFGANDDNQNNNDDPAMLDSVKDLASQPAAKVEPSQPAQTTTPAFGAPTAPVGFSMPSADTSAVNDGSSQDTTQDNPGLAMAANTAHAEPAEGFSNAADFNAANQVTQTNTSTPDYSAPQFASDSPAVSQPMDNPQPQTAPPSIIGHSNPAMQSAPQQNTSDLSQNEITPPPHLNQVDAQQTDEAEQAQQDTNMAIPTEVNHEELASIKQEALGHLEALSDHLEGDPEVIFTTTMQMIQANDNHSLIQKAFEAAKNIEDDKVRAQAMQDIINEINYFSPPQAQDGQ